MLPQNVREPDWPPEEEEEERAVVGSSGLLLSAAGKGPHFLPLPLQTERTELGRGEPASLCSDGEPASLCSDGEPASLCSDGEPASLRGDGEPAQAGGPLDGAARLWGVSPQAVREKERLAALHGRARAE